MFEDFKANFISETMLKHQRNPQPTKVLILPGCNHGNGMYKQTELYQNGIREFLAAYM